MSVSAVKETLTQTAKSLVCLYNTNALNGIFELTDSWRQTEMDRSGRGSGNRLLAVTGPHSFVGLPSRDWLPPPPRERVPFSESTLRLRVTVTQG